MDMEKDPAAYAEKPDDAGKTELCLCVYANGKFAVQVDDGEPVPVDSLEQGLEAIRRYAGELGKPTTLETGEPAEEDSEQAFAAGFQGARGVMS